jgi:hypothetical protein
MKNAIENNSVDYYLTAFEKLEKEKSHTWNFAAFFLGSDWLLYKKMYFGYTIAFVINYMIYVPIRAVIHVILEATYGLNWLPLHIEGMKVLSFLFAKLLMNILMGKYVNYFYYENVKKKIRSGITCRANISRIAFLWRRLV